MLNDELRTSIEAAWSAETAAGDNEWLRTNPAAGHCDVTALLVRETLGGDLKMVEVFRNGELSEYHYWNVLPDDTEVDLTKSQFDGDESLYNAKLLDDEFFESAGPMNDTLVQRLATFRKAVDAHRRQAS